MNGWWYPTGTTHNAQILKGDHITYNNPLYCKNCDNVWAKVNAGRKEIHRWSSSVIPKYKLKEKLCC